MDRLEDRCTPSLFASSGGVVFQLNNDSGAVIRSFTPFEAEARDVPLFLSQDMDTVYVGAGVGGGPRLSAFTNGVEKWSVFVGDPNSRTGVSVSAIPEHDTMTIGDGWTVWIDGNVSQDVFKQTAQILTPLNIKLTTDYPDAMRPGEYTTVNLHEQGNVGWRPTALGTVPERAVVNDSLYEPTVAYAPNYSANAIAHEIVHTIQPLNYPSHSTNTADLMYPYLTGGINIPDVEALNASISRLQEGWRFGIILSGTNGTFSFGEIDLTP